MTLRVDAVDDGASFSTSTRTRGEPRTGKTAVGRIFTIRSMLIDICAK